MRVEKRKYIHTAPPLSINHPTHKLLALTSRDTSRMTEKMGNRTMPGTWVMARAPSLMTRMATAMERRRATMMHTMMMVMAVKMYAAMRNLSWG
jgi:hypothetical protein